MKRTSIRFNSCRCNVVVVLTILLFGLSRQLSSQTWQWARAETVEGEGWSICSDPQGNVFMAGFTWSPGSIGTTTFTAAGNAFVTKYNSAGNILWTRGFAFTSNNHGQCHGLACDAAGNVFISGTFGGTIVIGTNTFVAYTAPNNAVYFDMFLVKYDASGNLLWAKVLGANYGVESGNSLCTDPSGNVFVSGQFSSSLAVGQSTINSYSYGNYFIAKYSPAGTPLWAVAPDLTAGGSNAYNFVRDNNGNLIICGVYQYSLSAGSTTLTSSSTSDYNYFVAKYDSLGAIQWLRGGGNTQNEMAFGIDADPTGNVYVTGGFFNPNLVVGSYTLTSAGSADAFVAKYSPSGSILWAKNIGSTGLEVGRSVKAYGGGFFLAGDVGPFGTCTLVIGTTSIVPTTIMTRWLAQFDGAGNPTGYVSYDYGTGNSGMTYNTIPLIIDKGCNLYLGGDVKYQAIIGNDTLTDVGYASPFLAKLQLPATNTVVVNVAGNLSICSGNSTTLSASGASAYQWAGGPNSNVFVVNPLTTTSYTVSGHNGCDVDSAIVTVTVNPTPTLQVTAGQPTYCVGDVAQLSVTGADSYSWSNTASTPSITVITSGSSNTISVVGTNNAGNCSSSISYVLNMVVCPGLNDLRNGKISVYPNPASTHLHIETPAGTTHTITLADPLGKKILTQGSVGTMSTLDLSDRPAGLYFITVKSVDGEQLIKVIKDK